MVRFILAAVTVCLAVGLAPAHAQTVCASRPDAPYIPERAEADTGLETVYAVHSARDAFVAAADAYRTCLDEEIVARRDAMFAANAPLDPVLDLRAHEHSMISAERAELMGRFVLFCLSWEDQSGHAYPRGCLMQP